MFKHFGFSKLSSGVYDGETSVDRTIEVLMRFYQHLFYYLKVLMRVY